MAEEKCAAVDFHLLEVIMDVILPEFADAPCWCWVAALSMICVGCVLEYIELDEDLVEFVAELALDFGLAEILPDVDDGLDDGEGFFDVGFVVEVFGFPMCC